MTAPFGIEFYSAQADLHILNDVGQWKFFVSPPKAHPAFEQYVVQATPRLGVVWIKAITPIFSNDAFGSRVRQAHSDLKIQLEKRYGIGKTTDFLMAGSIWNEDRDWAHGLTANERHYFTNWERPSAQLPEDLANVYLGANGFGGDETGFSIEYSSARLGDAEDEMRDMLSDLL